VTEREAEELLRETMRDHADRIDGGDVGGLLRRGRFRLAVRRGVVGGFATVATLAVAMGAFAAIANHHARPPSTLIISPNTLNSGDFRMPPGWVPRSSRGLQIAVPQDWTLNDFACHQTAAPSFVNSPNPMLCYTVEPPTKQVAVILAGPDGDYTGMTTVDADLGGVPVFVTRGRLADGRYAGLLAIPSRGVDLSVRTLDEATRETILASARLVAVCHYDNGDVPGLPAVLEGSAALDDTQRLTLASQLRAAGRGRNPDAPSDMCMDVVPPAPDALLLLGDGAGHVSRLWVTFEACSQRGVDNGAIQVHVTQAMITTFMNPLHATYRFTGDLPAS
jgi:hypothetical protein